MKTITLELDNPDYDAVQKAMAKRQSFRCWPDAESDESGEGEPGQDGSNIAGLAVAEICRGWMEMLDMHRAD